MVRSGRGDVLRRAAVAARSRDRPDMPFRARPRREDPRPEVLALYGGERMDVVAVRRAGIATVRIARPQVLGRV